MSMKSVLENQNRENLLNKLDRYYIYSIVELVILLVLCLVQVEFVKKLLCNTSNIVWPKLYYDLNWAYLLVSNIILI